MRISGRVYNNRLPVPGPSLTLSRPFKRVMYALIVRPFASRPGLPPPPSPPSLHRTTAVVSFSLLSRIRARFAGNIMYIKNLFSFSCRREEFLLDTPNCSKVARSNSSYYYVIMTAWLATSNATRVFLPREVRHK